MAGIMDMFSVELDEFVKDYDDLHWDVSFRGEEYQPRIVMEQTTPPLYKIEDDGSKTLEPYPTIQIIGRPDTEVVTTGKLKISKKDFTKLTNRAAALLELFLHGFMQERKEMEAAQE
nr:MAG TPA: hypothetical protein [Caudoviricetes sp.]